MAPCRSPRAAAAAARYAGGSVRRGDTVTGKYRLVREIGAGGMGVVWEARHVVTDRPFAIKFLSGPSRQEHYARFLQEARVSGLVRHPSIVDVYDVGTAPELDGVPFLVMDLLDGSSLKEVLAVNGKLTVRQTFAVMLPLVSALAAAHEAGVVHRDLKPSNLFVHRLPTGALVPKVLDFGISKLIGPARKISGSDERRRLTRTGAVLGSPLYMSPEQVRGDTTLDERSDVHAIGAILWECLTGELLFKGDLDDNELASQISFGDRRSLSELWPDCPPALSAIVSRCISTRRDERFASAQEVYGELERLQGELAPGVTLTDPKEANALFPLLSMPKIPKPLEQATTVDSDMPAGTPKPRGGDTVRSPQQESRSIEGWGDKRGATPPPKRRGSMATLVPLALIAGVAAFGLTRVRGPWSAGAPTVTTTSTSTSTSTPTPTPTSTSTSTSRSGVAVAVGP